MKIPDGVRLVIFFCIVACVIYGLFWVYQRPEYYTYLPENIKELESGTLYLEYVNCEYSLNTVGVINCETIFTEPPPAYYIFYYYEKIYYPLCIITVLFICYLAYKYRVWLRKLAKDLKKDDMSK